MNIQLIAAPSPLPAADRGRELARSLFVTFHHLSSFLAASRVWSTAARFIDQHLHQHIYKAGDASEAEVWVAARSWALYQSRAFTAIEAGTEKVAPAERIGRVTVHAHDGTLEVLAGTDALRDTAARAAAGRKAAPEPEGDFDPMDQLDSLLDEVTS